MHKFITLCAALLVGATSLFAQNRTYDPTGKFSIAVQGGGVFTVTENAFSYKDNGYGGKLITPQGSVSLGYDFTRTFGLRANVGFGKNMSAGNVKQTNPDFGNFYPYSFKSINYFVDAVLHLNGLNDSFSAFCPKLYAGIGGAHTFGFNEVPFTKYDRSKWGSGFERFHPNQPISEKNDVFAFRLGFIAEYNFSEHFGLFADISGEAYTDNYNGLMPSTAELTSGYYKGYAGFPFDLRLLCSIGAVLHF